MTAGRIGTLVDRSAFNARARDVLGYIPTAYKPMTAHELRQLGFIHAADAMEGKPPRWRLNGGRRVTFATAKAA